jgi:hypothetical protein
MSVERDRAAPDDGDGTWRPRVLDGTGPRAGRKWFDIPRRDFYEAASRADGDASLLDLIDPPLLMEVCKQAASGWPRCWTSLSIL